MSGAGGRFLILDANVLIDYCAADRWVLTLISQHVGPINVPAALLDEVNDLDASECDRLGVQVVELPPELLATAGKRRPGLSYYDHLCLLAAKQGGWTCVTNDGRLRQECAVESVAVLWGLEPMLDLIAGGSLTVAQAHEVAVRIHESNPLYITKEIVGRFLSRARAAAKKAR